MVICRNINGLERRICASGDFLCQRSEFRRNARITTGVFEGFGALERKPEKLDFTARWILWREQGCQRQGSNERRVQDIHERTSHGACFLHCRSPKLAAAL